nr:TlpA family protein disulfide reductase [bacterium]
VTSRDAFLTSESAPSSTETSQASDATILDVTVSTDKTTHHTGGAEPVANITAVSNTPGTSFAWSSTLGSVTGSGSNVTWDVPGGAAPQAVTITCTATAGPQSDVATLKLVLTSLTIKTSHADRGGGGNLPIGTPSGSGNTSPLTLTPFQYLAPLSTNPGKTISTYTGTLAQFTADKVHLLDRWELWCGPCKAEFPEIDDHAENYGPSGYIQVSLSNDSSPSYSCAQIANWFDSNGIDFCHQFFETGNDGMDAFWDSMGYDYYIPYNILVDRDGNVRKTGGAANTWDVDIAQLCGVPVI